MVFNSLDFGVFLIIVVPLVWLLPHRAQNRLLLVASYVFYAAWDWRFLGLIGISTVIDYFVGLGLGATQDPKRRKHLVLVSLVGNLGILGCFKYLGFFTDSLIRLLDVFGLSLRQIDIDVVLPVGISFYTFQTLSYTIDVYRKRLQPTRDFLDFALFVSFFPQLVAGPIERASRLLPQIAVPRRFTWSKFGSGCWLMLWGLFKKAVIADNMAAVVDGVFAPNAIVTGPEVVLGVLAFAFQIYCDFAGYSDIARGVARMLGFELMLNFDIPYKSRNPSEFWRRWHISLSTWLRDYLYISMGGNRLGRGRRQRNLILTMLLGGLWHGAAWTFVVWGTFHGVWLVVHAALQDRLAAIAPRGAVGARLWGALCMAVTFVLWCVSLLVFRADSLGHCVALFGTMFTDFDPGRVGSWLLPFAFLVWPLLLMEWFQSRTNDQEVIFRAPVWVRTLIYVLLVYAITILGEDFGVPFIYFQF
jgi:D-alanyl-lipoteichoic acid acyltransferase DltB (MBOAT superfamily)